VRAHFSDKYTSSARKPSRSLVGLLASAAAGLVAVASSHGGIAFAGHSSADGTGQARVQIDTWDEIANGLFRLLLQRALLNPPPSLDPKASPQAWAISFNKAYLASGVRPDLSPEESASIRDTIVSLDSLLRSEPDRLGADLQETSLRTLGSMYIDMGGDPDDLGH
jgi:hypothetical protein